MTAHGPHGDAWIICALDTPAVKPRGKNGSTTLETLCAPVEKKMKPGATRCSAQDWDIHSLWMIPSCSMTELKNAWTCGNTWFDDRMMTMITM